MDEIPSLFRLAKNVSKLSPHRVRLGAVIVKNGHPISVAHNQTKSNPHAPYCGLHAETNAIRYAGKIDLRGASIFVYRENRRNQISLARPCKHCLEELRQRGFKYMWYTTSEYPYFDCERI